MEISEFSRNDKQMGQLLPQRTFQKYSTRWHLAVFQTVQTHAQLLFYTHQYFQVHPEFQSASITQQTTVCL